MARKENSKRRSRAAAVSTKSVAATIHADEKRDALRHAPQMGQHDPVEPSAFSSQSIRRAALQYWPALIPVVLAIIASINTLGNDFAIDDLVQVKNNEFIRKLGNLPAAFTTSGWASMSDNIVFATDQYYRPLLNVLFIINYALASASAWGWHLISLLIHAAVALMVYVVINEMLGRKWLAVTAASLFAAHPVHTESVAWISGVTDPLMSLLLLPAFYFYLRYRKSARNYQIALALLFFLLALLSKETAIAFPIAVICYELIYFEREASLKQKAKRALSVAGLFIAPLAVYFVLRYNALGVLVSGTPARYSLAETLLTVPLAIAKYLKLIFLPTGYSYQHYTSVVESPFSISFIGLLLLIAAIAIAVWFINSRALKFAAVWFIVMLAPALAGMSRFDPEYLIQERYLYLPSMGICLALALGIELLGEGRSFIPHARKVAIAITVIIIIALGAVHIKQNQVWKDSVTVFKNVVEVYPNSAIAHSSLARAYYESGRPREAEDEANAALQLDPKGPAPYLTLAYFAQQTTKLNKAIYYLETAVSEVAAGPTTRKEMATIHLNLARLYSDRAAFIFKQTRTPGEEDLARAEENYRRSLEISPRLLAWYFAGQFYLGAGRFEEARAMYQLAIDHLPRRFAPVHRELGLVYQGLKQPEKAIAEYEKYLQIAPLDAKDRRDIEGQIERLRREGSTNK